MKRILLSLMTIAVVAAVGIGAARAYFSDTETSVGNTINAGTIDIAVDGDNPWTKTYTEQWSDMKPSYDRTMTFPIKNVGENPLVLWKRIVVTDWLDGVESEPECVAEGGTWGNPSGPCSGGMPKDDLDSVINYQMVFGGTTVIDKAWGVKMKDVDTLWVPLGKLTPGQELAMTQLYHMDETAGNEYQGDH